MLTRGSLDLRTGEALRFDMTITVRDARTGRIVEQRPFTQTQRRAVLIGYRVLSLLSRFGLA
jgi:hypothetical protein